MPLKESFTMRIENFAECSLELDITISTGYHKGKSEKRKGIRTQENVSLYVYKGWPSLNLRIDHDKVKLPCGDSLLIVGLLE